MLQILPKRLLLTDAHSEEAKSEAKEDPHGRREEVDNAKLMEMDFEHDHEEGELNGHHSYEHNKLNGLLLFSHGGGSLLVRSLLII